MSCIHRQTEQLLWNTNNSNKTYLQTRMATIGAQSTRHLFLATTRQEDCRDYSLLVPLQVRFLALVSDLETTKGYPDQKKIPVSLHPTGANLTRASFAALPPGQQRQVMGDHLYRAIYPLYPDLAVLLTRALLEQSYSELLPLLPSQSKLVSKLLTITSISFLAPGPHQASGQGTFGQCGTCYQSGND